MRYVEIAALDNGAHRNQMVSGAWGKVPEGWAIIPDDLETINFPFGEITVEETDCVMVVTVWKPLPIPEPEDGPEPPHEPTVEEQITDLQAMAVDYEYRLTLLELGVN